MPIYTWETVATVTGQEAAFVAYVIPTIKGEESQAHGPVSLQQLKSTPLFRLAVHCSRSGRIDRAFSLPVDEAWTASFGLVRGQSKSMGIKVTINLTEHGLEGYEKLLVFLPYDGPTGNATLFAEACVHASKQVERNILALMEAPMEAPTEHTTLFPHAADATHSFGDNNSSDNDEHDGWN